jgi:hypothetical protein
MDTRLLILLFIVLLGVALFVWRGRGFGPRMDDETARRGWEAVQRGAPLTRELVHAVAIYTARNGYETHGIVEATYGPDHYGLRLADGTLVRGTRSKALWQKSVVVQPGTRVAVLAVRGSDSATIRCTL